MEKKYIIKLEENEIAYKTVNSNGRPMIGLLHPSPYTEPDLEQVRKEAYDKCRGDVEMLAHKLYSPKIDGAYQRGLNDAWECVRKISSMDSKTRDEIFDRVITSNIVDENTASEAIEKIRQYEQGKEEQIQVGDEVEGDEDEQRGVVIDSRFENSQVAVLTGNSKVYSLWSKCAIHKTGRHFPEIAEALKKMRESE